MTSLRAVLQTAVVVETMLAGRPELACAAIANGDTPKILLGIASNVMVCEATADTVNVCVTAVAAAYFVLPAWPALMEHVPVATNVTAVPETVQTEVLFDVNVTVNPELALALSAGGAMPST
jgi:hypothetical protein